MCSLLYCLQVREQRQPSAKPTRPSPPLNQAEKENIQEEEGVTSKTSEETSEVKSMVKENVLSTNPIITVSRGLPVSCSMVCHY